MRKRLSRKEAYCRGGDFAFLMQGFSRVNQRMSRKILVMGLPGAGKTTFATALAPLLNAVVFNADAVRANLSRDLGFSHEDRVEHARRMGWMGARGVAAGVPVMADYIGP